MRTWSAPILPPRDTSRRRPELDEGTDDDPAPADPPPDPGAPGRRHRRRADRALPSTGRRDRGIRAGGPPRTAVQARAHTEPAAAVVRGPLARRRDRGALRVPRPVDRQRV